MTILTRDQTAKELLPGLQALFGQFYPRTVDRQHLEKVLKAFKNKPDDLKAMLDYLSYDHSDVETPTAVLERADVARSHIRYKI